MVSYVVGQRESVRKSVYLVSIYINSRHIVNIACILNVHDTLKPIVNLRFAIISSIESLFLFRLSVTFENTCKPNKNIILTRGKTYLCIYFSYTL